MKRKLWFIADDFGLSPGVGDGILRLIERRRISGTGCMTVFPDWSREANRLAEVRSEAAIGLHLVLTDQAALTGRSALAPTGRLPRIGDLMRGVASGRIPDAVFFAELDAQYDRFGEALGLAPDFIDGHQHVHFLPPVRRWLTKVAGTIEAPALPMLRGAPRVTFSGGRVAVKTAFVGALATSFDSAMTSVGYMLLAPLVGFYDWRRAGGFETAVAREIAGLRDGGVFMCHPGAVDDVLRGRDTLVEARPVEYDFLASDGFRRLLDVHNAEPARILR